MELDRGDPIPAALDAFEAPVVMGGPQDVWQEQAYPWLISEKTVIRHWVLEKLFLCLGHQLLAEAVGGKVAPMASPEDDGDLLANSSNLR